MPNTLREKCPNTEFFWSVFSSIRTEYGYSDQKKLRIWTLFTQRYITETKNNRRNNYRSCTGHEGERQKHNRNQRQDNSNNVITFQQANSNHQSNESTEIGDTLIEVLTSISRRTSSTETVIVPKTQNNDGMDSFSVNTPSQ